MRRRHSLPRVWMMTDERQGDDQAPPGRVELQADRAVGTVEGQQHQAAGGIDAIEIIRTAPQRVAHVHCKDIRRPVFDALGKRDASFLDGVLGGMFTVPGDGSLDFSALMQALRDMDYSGWIVVEAEQDPAVAEPRQYAKLGLETLRAEADAAGLWEAV